MYDAAEIWKILNGCECCCECECKDKKKPEPEPPKQRQVPKPRKTTPPVIWPSEDDTPFIPAVPEYDTPQRPAAFGDDFHIPGVAAGGVFVGEQGYSQQLGTVVLDDGSLDSPKYLGAVDHDRRVVYGTQFSYVLPPELSPPALPYSIGGRGLPDGVAPYKDYATDPYSMLNTAHYVDVTDRGTQPMARLWQEQETYFDGRTGQRNAPSDTVALLARDFRLQTGDKTITRYRTAKVRTQDFVYDVLQGCQEDLTIDITDIAPFTQKKYVKGVFRSGWMGPVEHVVKQVLGEGQYLYDRWVPLAETIMPADPAATFTPNVPNGGWLDTQKAINMPPQNQVLEIGDEVGWLRDEYLIETAPSDTRFTALGGAVTVWGPRTLEQANLWESKLTAWGHIFEGGTWAALRDRPARKKDSTLDFDTIIILHASDTTVTAIRPDGSSETCSRAEFETHVLRVPEGSFKDFGNIGSLSHSWPPEWAWANCAGETRAIIAHDPWRDSYKRLPKGTTNPKEWYWPARPPRRPRVLPKTAPRGLLGLTLADVVGTVTQDEQLKKGEGPLRLPLKATQTRADGTVVDITRKVAKHSPYSPAHIADERDDRTSVTGTFTVTFGPLPELLGGA